MLEKNPSISVVVPIWNDRQCIAGTAARIHAALGRVYMEYEIIFVDDGSSDGSFEEIDQICTTYPRTRGVRLERHAGQHAALLAGLSIAKGDVLVNFDVDLQGDPEDIPRLVSKTREGFDMVCAWRKNRNDPWIRRFLSLLMNWLINRYSGVVLHDHGGYKAITRQLADKIASEGVRRRFLTGLVPMLAMQVAEIPVAWHKREQGRSRYNLRTLVAMAMEFFLWYRVVPFPIITCLGIAIAIASVLQLSRTCIDNYFCLCWPMWADIIALLCGLVILAVGGWGWLVKRAIEQRKDAPLFMIAQVVDGKE